MFERPTQRHFRGPRREDGSLTWGLGPGGGFKKSDQGCVSMVELMSCSWTGFAM